MDFVFYRESDAFHHKGKSEGTKSKKLVLHPPLILCPLCELCVLPKERSLCSLCSLCVLPKERSLCALCPLYELCVLPSKRCFLLQRHKEYKVRASSFCHYPLLRSNKIIIIKPSITLSSSSLSSSPILVSSNFLPQNEGSFLSFITGFSKLFLTK